MITFYPFENTILQVIKLNQLAQAAGGGGDTSWTDLKDKPAVIAAGATVAEARSAIGAGTSNLAIGTTSTTAKAGNYQPTAANISDATTVGKSVMTAVDAAAARAAIGAGVSDLTIGTTATTAKAGNYAPTWAQVSGKPVGVAVADATSAEDVVVQFNALLASLRTAGFIAT